MSGRNSKSAGFNVTTNNLVQRIVEFVEEQLAGDLHQNTVASHFRISTVTLRKIFKARFNLTFHKYVERERMRLAYHLIAVKGMLVKEAMYSTGYTNRITFINAFRRHFGKLPSEFK